MLKVESEAPQVRLIGELSLDTANEVLADSRRWLSDDIDTLDLSGVTNSDSAAIALLLEWQKERPDIKFIGIPGALLAVAKLSNLADTINIA